MDTAPEEGVGESGTRVANECYAPEVACVANTKHDGVSACEPVDQDYCKSIGLVYMYEAPTEELLAEDCHELSVACSGTDIHDGVSACRDACPVGEIFLVDFDMCEIMEEDECIDSGLNWNEEDEECYGKSADDCDPAKDEVFY